LKKLGLEAFQGGRAVTWLFLVITRDITGVEKWKSQFQNSATHQAKIYTQIKQFAILL